MTRHTHTYDTTTVILDERAHLVLRCAQDPSGTEAELTDKVAFLVHAAKLAQQDLPDAVSTDVHSNTVDFGELRLDQHGHVSLDGRRVRAQYVLELAAAGLESMMRELAAQWRERADVLEQSLEESGRDRE